MKLFKFVQRTVSSEHEVAILKQEIINTLREEVGTIMNLAQLLEESPRREMTPLKFAIECENERGFSPLQAAVDNNNSVVAKVFLEVGADVSSIGRDFYRRTPLHLAAYNNDNVSIMLLLSHGADVHARNLQYETPLLVAIKYGSNSDDEALATLKNFMAYRANVNEVDASGCLFIQHAAARGFFKTVQYLLEQQVYRVAIPREKAASSLRPILSIPIEKGDAKMVDFLLSRGVNIAAIDIQNKCTIFATACMLQDANIVRVMLPYVNNAILIDDAFLKMQRCSIDSAEIRKMLEQKKALLPRLLLTDKEKQDSLIQLITLEKSIIAYTGILEPVACEALTPPDSEQDTSEIDSSTDVAMFSGVLNYNAKTTPQKALESRNVVLTQQTLSDAPANLNPPTSNLNPPTPNWNPPTPNLNPSTPNWDPPYSNVRSNPTSIVPSSWRAHYHSKNSTLTPAPTPTPSPIWNIPQAPIPSSLFPVRVKRSANHNSALLPPATLQASQDSALLPPTTLQANQGSALTPPASLIADQGSAQTYESHSDVKRKNK